MSSHASEVTHPERYKVALRRGPAWRGWVEWVFSEIPRLRALLRSRGCGFALSGVGAMFADGVDMETRLSSSCPGDPVWRVFAATLAVALRPEAAPVSVLRQVERDGKQVLLSSGLARIERIPVRTLSLKSGICELTKRLWFGVLSDDPGGLSLTTADPRTIPDYHRRLMIALYPPAESEERLIAKLRRGGLTHLCRRDFQGLDLMLASPMVGPIFRDWAGGLNIIHRPSRGPAVETAAHAAAVAAKVMLVRAAAGGIEECLYCPASPSETGQRTHPEHYALAIWQPVTEDRFLEPLCYARRLRAVVEAEDSPFVTTGVMATFARGLDEATRYASPCGADPVWSRFAGALADVLRPQEGPVTVLRDWPHELVEGRPAWGPPDAMPIPVRTLSLRSGPRELLERFWYGVLSLHRSGISLTTTAPHGIQSYHLRAMMSMYPRPELRQELIRKLKRGGLTHLSKTDFMSLELIIAPTFDRGGEEAFEEASGFLVVHRREDTAALQAAVRSAATRSGLAGLS